MGYVTVTNMLMIFQTRRLKPTPISWLAQLLIKKIPPVLWQKLGVVFHWAY